MSNAKNVVVTGASSGIGEATAKRYASEGWSVCLTARRESELERVLGEMAPGKHLIVAGDYSHPDTTEKIAELIQKQWDGELWALVNCAGTFDPHHVTDSDVDQWKAVFNLLLDGGVYTTRMAVSFMKNGGRIVHITSIHGERAEAMASNYSMAKAALNQYCRALALELAERNILVNAIAPGFVSTPMSVVNGVNELETDWFRQNYVEGHHLAMKRPGKPEEIAGVAWFLTGPDASYLTGQVITVDGGLTIAF